MPAVNWDQPSSGLVSDTAPSLTLKNDQGLALSAEAATMPAAGFVSGTSIGVIAQAPLSTAVMGLNRDNAVATIGACGSDPNLPPIQNSGGVGVLGLTDRFDALGVAGIAEGPRSVGVHGEATVGGTGVIGRGTGTGVEGTASAGTGVAGFALGGSASAEGVFGQGTLLAAGVRAEADGGPGVDAHAVAGPAVQALSDRNHGVVAQTTGKDASGVQGLSVDGAGVEGFSQAGPGVSASSQAGEGVHARSETGTAVDARSTYGGAIYAQTLGNGDPAVGIYTTLAPALDAVALTNTCIRAYGTRGVDVTAFSSASVPGSGVGVSSLVVSQSLTSAGVWGEVTGAGIGVVGIGHSVWQGMAGVFVGDVAVDGGLNVSDGVQAGHIETGLLAAGFKLFVIDHPLDPARKVLRHACVEAPDYKTFYDGVVALNTRGRGRVRLPRWFAALNGDLRYQLTPLGRGAPDLHVAEPFTEEAGVFVIAGGHPGQSVCWQVTGIRRDPAALARPLKVEDRKPPPPPAHPRPETGVKDPAELEARIAAIREEAENRAREAKTRPMPEPISAPARREPSVPSAAVARAVDGARQAIARHASTG